MSRELCYFVEARLIVAARPALVNESNRDRIGWLITLGAGFSAYGKDEADDSEDRSSSRLTNPAPRFFACSGWIRHKFANALHRAPAIAPDVRKLKAELRYRHAASGAPA